MPSRIGGTLYYKVNGVQYPAKGKFKYSPFTSEKTGVAGQDGPHGYNEKPRYPTIEGSLSDLGTISVSQMQDSITGGIVTLELGNGKIVVLSDCWFEGTADVDTEEGEYPIKIGGTLVQEITA